MKNSKCSFCGIADSGLEFLRGPKELCICANCLVKSEAIIAVAKKSYACDFCGKQHGGDSNAEGPGPIHICIECVGAALSKLRAKPSRLE
jgi:hypothetical protein